MNIKVIQVTMMGKLPFKRKLKHNEVNKMINMGWFLINEKYPMLQKKIELNGEIGTISVSMNGIIYFFGIKKVKQGKDLYNFVLKEIKNNLKDIM